MFVEKKNNLFLMEFLHIIHKIIFYLANEIFFHLRRL